VFRHAGGDIHTVNMTGWKQHVVTTSGDYNQYSETSLASNSNVGDTTLTVNAFFAGAANNAVSSTTVIAGDPITIGSGATVEVAEVVGISASVITVLSPLRFAHVTSSSGVAADTVIDHGVGMSFSINTYGVALRSCHFEGMPVEVMLGGVRNFTSDGCYHGGGEHVRSVGVISQDAQVVIRNVLPFGTTSASTNGVARNIIVEIPAAILAVFASAGGPFIIDEPTVVPTGTGFVVFTHMDAQGSSISGVQEYRSFINPSTGGVRDTRNVTSSFGTEKVFEITQSGGEKFSVTYNGNVTLTNSNTSAGVTIPTAVTVTSGSAFTPATGSDCEIFFIVTAAGTLTMTYGPSTGAENPLVTAVAVPLGASFTKRIPAGWKVVITLTTATISSVKLQSV
jgi:hypothetical protein